MALGGARQKDPCDGCVRSAVRSALQHLSTLPVASPSGSEKRLVDCAHIERTVNIHRRYCARNRSVMENLLSALFTPEHWRRQAAQMRKIAAELSILNSAQASILRIADNYEQRAVQAERLFADKSPDHVGGRG